MLILKRTKSLTTFCQAVFLRSVQHAPKSDAHVSQETHFGFERVSEEDKQQKGKFLEYRPLTGIFGG